MASLFQFGHKLKRAVSGVRRFSGCVIKGASEDIYFPSWMWESLADHAAHTPLVCKVRERLITADPYAPLKINDPWRKILFSALVHSVLCKEAGDCIHDAYNLNNVGIIKGLNILGFRKFERFEGIKNANHDEYITFVHNLFSSLCDPSTLQQVRDVYCFLQLFNGALPDDCLLHNPVFLHDEGIAGFYQDTHRLSRCEFPVRGFSEESKDIRAHMENQYCSNEKCVKACQGTFFRFLLGGHEKTPERMKKFFKEPPFGTAVIDIPRIIVTHGIEWELLDRARKQVDGLGAVLYDYRRPEVLEGCRHMFSVYPHHVVYSFAANGVWPQLRMVERLPIPDIYGYRFPWRH